MEAKQREKILDRGLALESHWVSYLAELDTCSLPLLGGPPSPFLLWGGGPVLPVEVVECWPPIPPFVSRSGVEESSGHGLPTVFLLTLRAMG